MDTIHQSVLIAHVLIAIGIIALVLLQRGKGADAGAAFGAGASGTVFGARGSSSFFSRMTAIFATAFFASSLGLAYLSSQKAEGPGSLLENAPVIENEAEMGPVDGEDDLSTELPSVGEDIDAGEALPAIDDALPAGPEEDDGSE